MSEFAQTFNLFYPYYFIYQHFQSSLKLKQLVCGYIFNQLHFHDNHLKIIV
ncbi:hypothetical protein pb186bvf_006398 [Paramecium bursaria]